MLFLLVACCRPDAAAPVVPAPQPMIEVRQVRIDCITDKPPKPSKVEFLGEGCPEQFAACLTQDGARSLLRYLDELQQYAVSAWTMCGNEPLPEE